MKIKIIAIPPGEAPEEIRKEWIGMILPVAENKPPDTIQRGVVSGKSSNITGYSVETEVAIEELGKKNSEAANWWKRHVNLCPFLKSWLIFSGEVCELIP